MSRGDEEIFVLLPDGVTVDSLRAGPSPLSKGAVPGAGAPKVAVPGMSGQRIAVAHSIAPSAPARSAGMQSAGTPSAAVPISSRLAAAPAPIAAGRGVPLALVSGIVATALLLGVLAWGWTYYRLPLETRPLHPRHDALRSSGTVGLSLAMAGTTLMLLNLAYLLRKWVPWLHRVGSLRGWMGFHVLTGLLGPAMIVLHSGLRLTSVLGTLSFAAMLVVVCAGIIGRYIYSRVPRSIAGHELELEEVRRRLGELERRLASFGIDARRAAGAASAAPSRGFFSSIVSLAAGDRELRKEWRRHRAAVIASPRARQHARVVLPLLRGVAREGQWLARYHELRTLMRSWRFLHRWLALVMLMLAAFHIGVAIGFGDLWVLP